VRKLICGVVLVASLAFAGSAFAATPTPVWPTASELTLPTNADTAAGSQDADLNAVTCTSAENCVGVGSYVDVSADVQPMAVTESDGVWGAATELTPPTGSVATTAGYKVSLNSVTCTSAGNCVAVGEYEEAPGSLSPGYQEAMVVTESGGVWYTATEASLPGDADTSASDQYANLDAVTCTSVGNCVAVGNYRNNPVNPSPAEQR
jgi:ferredoxin